MAITVDQLATSTGSNHQKAMAWLEAINTAMARFGIDTPTRQAAFLAQIGHESGSLQFVLELWGPTDAQKGYEGRKDLGNTKDGDGFWYRGRGLIQITGRANYRSAGVALGLPLEEHPEQLELPDHAAASAAWFWQMHKLNDKADLGDFQRITKTINGGLNGYRERVALWYKARAVLGAA